MSLAGDPGQIVRQPLDRVQGEDLRGFVGMVLAEEGFKLVVAFRRGLDYQRNLPIFLQRALPVIHRMARRENVDTGGQSLFHQQTRQLAGAFLIG